MKILSILGLFSLFFIQSFAQKFDAKAGWNLFGATETISNMQVFDECAYLWVYNGNEFLTYGKGEGIASIQKEDGFWLYGMKDCLIDTETVPVASITPMPDVSDTNVSDANTDTGNALDAQTIFASSCFRCHGEFGGGTNLAKEIAGRTLTYLTTALIGYKDGTYGNAQKETMQEQVKDLNKDQLNALALYVSTLDSNTGLSGAMLFSTSCSSCHGGEGQGGVGPKLMGKTFESIQNALHSFKDKTRSNSTMQAITEGIKFEELNRIVKHISTL